MNFRRVILLLGVLAVLFFLGLGIYVKMKLDPYFNDPVATLEVTEYEARKITGATTDINLGYAMISLPQVSHAEVYQLDDYGALVIQIGDDEMSFATPEAAYDETGGENASIVEVTEAFLSYQPMSLLDLAKVGVRQYVKNQMMVYTKVVFFKGTTIAYSYERENYRFLITDGPSGFLSVLIFDSEADIQQSLLFISRVDDMSDLWIYIDAILGSYDLNPDVNFDPDTLVSLVHQLGYPHISETWVDEF